MSDWPQIPLEDTFGDCLRKAMRGNRLDTKALAQRTAIDAQTIERWLADDGTATRTQADTLARVLHLDPAKFADRAAGAWAPPPIERLDITRHPQLPHPSNGYVFSSGERAALVDPAGIPANLLRILRERRERLDYILITHKHADHCDAAAGVAAAFPEAKIVMHESDLHAIGTLGSQALRVRDGDALAFGETTIRMLHTPGHTDGSSCFLFDSALFTGDTLFAGSVGGAYGDRSTYADILRSVSTKIFTLPEETLLMPGHGPPSTIALEKIHDPFFTLA